VDSRSDWTPLREALDPERFGRKAATLAALVQARSPVLPGWVAPVDVDPDPGALLDLHATRDWMLRSSSPLEDRPEGSAAGVFHSGHAPAVVEELRDEIDAVRASGRTDRARSLLGDDAARVAVLAQPFVAFDRWCTLELDAEGYELEGWIFEDDGAPRRWREGGGRGDRIVGIARRAARAASIDHALLEIGTRADDVWVLQIRPAPGRRPRHDEPRIEAPADLPGLGARVAPGDADVDWVWDREHSPLPLCPLLATVFGRWIDALEGAYPSRLIQGRWHDRPRDREATREDPDMVEALLSSWRTALDALPRAIDRVDTAIAALDGGVETWREFVSRWLDVQALYFDVPSGRLRRWAHRLEQRQGIDLRPRPGTTVAAQRAATWRALGRRILEREDVGAETARGLRSWIEAHGDDPLAREIRAALDDAGHLCALPYDGRGVPWEEDPAPFLRALLRHAKSPVAGPERHEDDDRATALARDVVTLAEDDDDLLLRTYLRWRRALTAVAPTTPAAGAPDPLLDLIVDDLEHWMRERDETAFRGALDRGRALAAHWRGAIDDGAASGLVGRPAAPGRAEGTVVRAAHLGDVEPDRPDTIAVVSTVLPADASIVPFLAGLVCKSGDVLGHASILAREAAIPCVVDVGDARRRLARADRVVVDGDSGRVIVTS